jgi:hypothetical protein
VTQILSYLGCYTSDLIVRLLPVTCGSSIYHPRDFQEFWRLLSSGTNYWAFQGFMRAQS